MEPIWNEETQQWLKPVESTPALRLELDEAIEKIARKNAALLAAAEAMLTAYDLYWSEDTPCQVLRDAMTAARAEADKECDERVGKVERVEREEAAKLRGRLYDEYNANVQALRAERDRLAGQLREMIEYFGTPTSMIGAQIVNNARAALAGLEEKP